MMRPKDEVGIVTGAGDGIGRGIAFAFAKEGAGIAICDLNKVALNETAAIVRECGADVFAEPFDVSNPFEIQSFVSEVNGRFNRIDCPVSNAAVMPIAQTDSIEPDMIDLIFCRLTCALLCFTPGSLFPRCGPREGVRLLIWRV